MAKKIQAQKMSREAESQFIANNLGGFMGARQNAFDWMNPANNAAMLERYRQGIMSAAGQAGQQGANMAAWSGAGSGAQQAMQNSALMQGLGQVGGFARQQLSPEYAAAQFAGLRGIMDPFMNRTEKELSLMGKQGQATKAQYSGGGGLAGFLGQVGQLGGMIAGMGGNPMQMMGFGGTPGTGGPMAGAAGGWGIGNAAGMAQNQFVNSIGNGTRFI